MVEVVIAANTSVVMLVVMAEMSGDGALAREGR